MKTQQGIKLSEFPFKNMTKKADLIAFDGPILCHFQDEYSKDYLSYWVDQDANAHRWLIFRIHERELYYFLMQQVSLRALILSEKNEFVYFADIADTYQNVLCVNPHNIEPDYLPEPDYYFTYTIPAVYKELMAYYQTLPIYKALSLFVEKEFKTAMAKKDITSLSDIGIIYYFLGKKADFNQKILELLPDKSPKLIQDLEKKYQLQY